uniref:RNase H type-1 domain-containing protein n=1 Tax=Chenopodium quinoa TaxID=63459 RepID=A0A803LIM7_CHEQI
MVETPSQDPTMAEIAEQLQETREELRAACEQNLKLQCESQSHQASLEKLNKKLEFVKSNKKRRFKTSDIPQFFLISSDESEGEEDDPKKNDKEFDENPDPMGKKQNPAPGRPDELQLDEVVLDESKLDQIVKIGAALPADQKEAIIKCLKKNSDCFAWSRRSAEVATRGHDGMNLAKDVGAPKLQVFCDSLLVASQMNGEFAAKDSKMILYLDFAKSLATKFTTFSINQKPRDRNTQEDALPNLGSALRKSKFSSIPLIHLLAPTINTDNQTSKPINPNSAKLEPYSSKVSEPAPFKPVKDEPIEPNIVAPVANQTSWIQPIFNYLEHDTLPENKDVARALKFKASKTTPRTATGQTPFSLVYGCEAVLPAEVTTPTARYGLLTPERNNEKLSHDVDTIEERRDLAYIRMTTYQQMVARSFNKNVKARIFKVGDWVLRKVFQNTREINAGKLGAYLGRSIPD